MDARQLPLELTNLLIQNQTHALANEFRKNDKIIIANQHIYAPTSFTPQPTDIFLQYGGRSQTFRQQGNLVNHLKLPRQQYPSKSQQIIANVVNYYLDENASAADAVNSQFSTKELCALFIDPVLLERNCAYTTQALTPSAPHLLKRSNVLTSLVKNNNWYNKFCAASQKHNIRREENTWYHEGTNNIKFKKSRLDANKDEITFTTLLPRFTSIADNKKYVFPAVEIETQLILIQNNYLTLNSYPKITTPDYEHFFVFGSGNICYAGPERWRELGIFAGKSYSLNTPGLAFTISRVILQANQTLMKGYTDYCLPINKAENLDKYLVA